MRVSYALLRLSLPSFDIASDLCLWVSLGRDCDRGVRLKRQYACV